MKTMAALLKREWWENQVFWILPAAFAGVLVLAQLYGFFSVSRMSDLPVDRIADIFNQFAELEGAERRNLIKGMLVGMAVPFNMFLVGIMFFYSLDSLYDDRRDRSILFWKSMPVSDVQTVLSKLLAVTLLAPAATLAIVIGFHLFNLVMLTIAAWVVGASGWHMMWGPLSLLDAWSTLAWALLAQSLVFLPMIAWIMLASAWAKRAPFLWAVAPPAAVIVVESIFTRGTVLGTWIVSRLTEGLPLALNITVNRGSGIQFNGVHVDEDGVSADAIEISFALLGSGLLWSGVAVAAVFLAGAVWLRRYRADPE